LSLIRPQPKPGLEARFLGPFLERHFGADYVDPQYALDQARDALPPNVEVHEFYMQSGAKLHSGSAQRNYISQNYTHVARDLVVQDINLLVQLVARRETSRRGALQPVLQSRPDPGFPRSRKAAGKPRPLCVAVVHPDLPYHGWRGGSAGKISSTSSLRPPASPPLFALPRLPVDLVEYALGLHASALVKDGGCLQIGIGALSDALVGRCCCVNRTTRSGDARWWRWTPRAARMHWPRAGRSGTIQGGPVRRQRNGDGRLHAPAARRHPETPKLGQPRLERASAAGRWLKTCPAVITCAARFSWVRATCTSGCRLPKRRSGRHRHVPRVQRQPAVWRSSGAGHAAASRRTFFQHLHDGDVARRSGFRCLEDGDVVSGVGGQYNFVAMAHELPGGRSVLLMRSTRKEERRRKQHSLELRSHHHPTSSARCVRHRIRRRRPARQER
jgi:hypothetical protein